MYSQTNPSAGPELRYRLALFPLPVVLLPGASMPLHIFEPRYQELVRHCLEREEPFGMVYHDWDEQGPFLSEEGRVGCVAGIQEFQPLGDGRSLITTQGVERFRIADGIESETPYFEALVSPYEDTTVMQGSELARRRQESIDLFHSVVQTLDEVPEGLPTLVSDVEASFPLARTIQINPGWHQRLLELRDEGSRLARIDRVLRAVRS